MQRGQHGAPALFTALLILSSSACLDRKNAPSEDIASIEATVKIKEATAHAGASRLISDGVVWASVRDDWSSGQSWIRVSDGPETIVYDAPCSEGTVVAGVHAGRAYIVDTDSTPAAVSTVDRSGARSPFTTLPPELKPIEAHVDPRGALVVLASAAGRTADTLLVLARDPERTERAASSLMKGDAVIAFATDPSEPRAAVLTAQMSGKRGEPFRPPRIILFDTAQTRVAETISLEGHIAASDGHIVFDDRGTVWIRRGDALEGFGPSGERLHHDLGYVHNVRNVAYRQDLKALALSSKFGGGHGSLSESCKIGYVDLTAPKEGDATRSVTVRDYKRRCYFGVGMRFDDDGTLWIAPVE